MNDLIFEGFDTNPITQFQRWFSDAMAQQNLPLPERFCLSTLGVDGYPEGRILLLKDITVDGFTFYTNYHSAKAKSLEKTPKAAMTFYWNSLGRQVRIQGDISTVSSADSDTYFASRPRASQIGVWVSHQSDVISDRVEFERAVSAATDKFKGKDVSRPPSWGGYLLSPHRMEFWIDAKDRLHHRLDYRKTDSGEWKTVLLYP